MEKNPTIRYLLNDTGELKIEGDEIISGDGFKEYYDRYHHSNFQAYRNFLERNSLLKPQTRFEEGDIKILMDIELRMATGDLLPIRNQIIEAEESVRGVSRMFFKNEKYLLGKTSLIDAVKYLLKIEVLADDRDQQYMYVLKCDEPRTIVLCENLDFLKRPTAPRKNQLELWYAGGKNVEKLKYVDTRGLPIYYSCDWDYDGLLIYKLVKEKIPRIQLLYPNGQPVDIVSTDHDSHWRFHDDLNQLSGLDQSLFNDKQVELIKSLIQKNEWIIEESNNLLRYFST